jgi:hypothetical protein
MSNETDALVATESGTIWATVVLTVNSAHQDELQYEPATLVQRITKNVILCGGPSEHYSNKMPAVPHDPDVDFDLLPIDILYGCYNPDKRAITLYVKRIEQHAPRFGAKFEDLLPIVHIHEYAHAIVHLGVAASRIASLSRDLMVDQETNWTEFITTRDAWFKRTTTEVHEFLAQSITYGILTTIEPTSRSQTLIKVFEELEKHQPIHYRISGLAKNYAASADWALVLKALQGGELTPWLGRFPIIEGIDVLCSRTAGLI